MHYKCWLEVTTPSLTECSQKVMYTFISALCMLTWSDVTLIFVMTSFTLLTWCDFQFYMVCWHIVMSSFTLLTWRDFQFYMVCWHIVMLQCTLTCIDVLVYIVCWHGSDAQVYTVHQHLVMFTFTLYLDIKWFPVLHYRVDIEWCPCLHCKLT